LSMVVSSSMGSAENLRSNGRLADHADDVSGRALNRS
jgi:hypothetical protein